MPKETLDIIENLEFSQFSEVFKKMLVHEWRSAYDRESSSANINAIERFAEYLVRAYKKFPDHMAEIDDILSKSLGDSSLLVQSFSRKTRNEIDMEADYIRSKLLVSIFQMAARTLCREVIKIGEK